MQSASLLTNLATGVKMDGACIGRLIRLGEEGLPLVDFDSNPGGPIGAKIGLFGEWNFTNGLVPGALLVLVFENGDSEKPIIVGILQEGPLKFKGEGRGNAVSQRGTPTGAHLRIEAGEELTLICGKGSLTIRKDGKIVVYGTNIISRATQVNKIKGGAVRIN